MNSPILRKLVSALLALLLLIYVGYQVYNAGYQSVRTETAVYASMKDVAQTTGFAVRKETVIPQSSAGVVTYTLGKGGKVSKGGVVAEIYSSAADAAAQQEIKSLNEEIESLTKLNSPGDTYAANPDLLDKQINQKLSVLLEDIHNKDYEKLEEPKDAFLYLLNEKQIVTGKVKNYNERISALKSRRDSLTASAGQKAGQVTSPVAGYFIGEVDGYEPVFNYDDILNITVDDIRAAEAKNVAPDVGAIGKVSQQFDWYFACVLPPETALKLSRVQAQGRKVSISMPFASTEPIPATVAAINQKDRESEAAVVLKCSYMNEELASIREETLQIQIAEYTGIRVSHKAVHFETVLQTVTDKDGKSRTEKHENVRGVYVMHGSEIEFVQIFPLFSSGSYVICEALEDGSPSQEELVTDRSVQLSDEVVVEGTDLFDGKVVK